MPRLTTVIACLLFVCHATAQNTSPLERLLESELSRFPARAGIYVKHLETGEEAGVRADEAFNSASVIKITIMAMALQFDGR